MRTTLRLLLAGVCVVLCIASPALAQLTSDDIAALRDRALQEGWTFTVGENPATQYSIDQLTGLRVPDELPVPPSTGVRLTRSVLPTAYDWRTVVGNIPVRNQGSCGSCWAFATIGALEWGIRIWDGVIVNLSEQWLVSCDEESHGCGGGWRAFEFFLDETDPCGHTGAVLEADFPYAAADLPCACPYPHHYFIETWGEAVQVGGSMEIDEIKQAIMNYGPVYVHVAVTSAFQAYSSGVFNACDGTDLNHAVVLVGWDDAQGTEGVWILRNSWGSWGENGYMRIEYGCSRVGTYASYLVYTGPQNPGLNFSYPAGIPDTVAPYEETPFIVDLSARYNGIPVPGSGQLHYTINGGPAEVVPMTEIAPLQYEAVLPRVACDDKLEFYVSAEEQTSGRIYDPDPASPCTVEINSDEMSLLKDNFFTDLGWVVYGDATAGQWQRGIPLGHGDRCDPMRDYDNSGSCYLTGKADGDSDVEGGVAYLESPAFDLAAGDARVRYARWFCNDFDGQAADDVFVVEISDDNGATWNMVETVGPDDEASGGWITHEFWAGDIAGLTDQMKLRFTASDLGDSSVVEAAVDAVTVTRYSCYACDCTGHCDVNLDGDINPVDVVYLVNFVYKNLDARLQLSTFCPGTNGDWNSDNMVNPLDVVYYVNFVYKNSGIGPDNPCLL